jgi:NAD+ kinase
MCYNQALDRASASFEDRQLGTDVKAKRVYFLGNPEKEGVQELIDELVAFAEPQCTVVGSGLGLDGRPAVVAGADRIITIGGDGTLIGVARSLRMDQIPLVGVNVGKLGFLAEFSVEELKSCFEAAVADDSLISRRALLQVTVQHDGDVRHAGAAINDCVIQAGPPFRMIVLGVSVNGEHLTEIRGDGLILCTPSGSTAHNLSAGGPIMQPGVDAMVLTPLTPHSLTHRPLVIERGSVIEIVTPTVNEGTTAIIDGQVSYPLRPGDRVTVKRFGADYMLVHNPCYPRWHNLVTKLHWGQSPNYD